MKQMIIVVAFAKFNIKFVNLATGKGKKHHFVHAIFYFQLQHCKSFIRAKQPQLEETKEEKESRIINACQMACVKVPTYQDFETLQSMD